MSDCAHSWEPILTWHARYRCCWCYAVAYKNLVNGGAKGLPFRMTVYICDRDGCSEPAIRVERRLKRCLGHRDKSTSGQKTAPSSQIEISLPSTATSDRPTQDRGPGESEAPQTP